MTQNLCMNPINQQKLDMDINASVCAHNHTNVFKDGDKQFRGSQKGFFLKTWVVISLLMVAVLCIVGVALLVGMFSRFYSCGCDYTTNVVSNCLTNDSIHDINQTNSQCSVNSSDCTTEVLPLNASSTHLYVRLPTSVVPIHYDVELQAFIGGQDFYFNGNVTLLIECKEDTHNITLHINDIIIYNDSVKLFDDRQRVLPFISNFSYDSKLQFFIINLKNNLKEGKQYILKIKFRGNLNEDLAGFYRSSYKDNSGNKRWLAVTQFQPTDARRAFPCFDEPSMKATFIITLIHYKNMSAISNMPRITSEDRGEWMADTFEKTIKMSTYLLAFLISDFHSISDPKANFTVWTRPNAISTANYSLDVGPKILRCYEEYFNISYPMPKTGSLSVLLKQIVLVILEELENAIEEHDMVAVPDFNAGAMENWGLIVYRETAMLYDPAVSSSNNLQRVAAVVAHELAHQWFGNLVTPKWWDDLWLNEGFASYMEYEAVNVVHPKWQMFQQFVIEELQDVFELDCLTTSHPISVPVHNPDEINEIFDKISYGKGASIIRMMTYFLSKDTFRKGVSNYLNAWKYDNAVQDDLWNHLTLAANNGVNVKRVMDSWTLQDGYPVVTLNRNYSKKTASLTQKRFLLYNTLFESNQIDSSKYLWEIPITMTDQRDPNWDPITKLWMNRTDSQVKEEDIPDNDQWMIMNLQEVGYYRANYDTTNWELIIRQLMRNHSKIDVINRAQLLDDSLDLSRAHLLDYHISLNITEYLTNEREFIPWESALNAFSFLDRMLRRSSVYGLWKIYVLKLLIKLYNEVTWNVKEDLDNMLDNYAQISVIGWVCKYGHNPCIQQSMERFKNWRNSIESGHQNYTIHANLKGTVYCTAIEYGSESDWDFLWNQYLNASVASEKDKLLRSLACSREPWLLSRYISRAFNGSSGIRKQDGSLVFRAVASNNFGRDIAYNFLRDKWSEIVKYFGKSFFSFGHLVKSVTSSLNTEFELLQLLEFYDTVKENVGTAHRAFMQSIEQTKANVQWMQNHFQQIDSWLTRRKHSLIR